MNEKFQQIIDSLQPKLEQLLSLDAVNPTRLPADIPLRGVYLLSEGDKHLYVGRSNSIPTRIRNHYRGKHRQAAFAFKLARDQTGLTIPSYRQAGSRDDLMTKSEFVAAFHNAQTRISRMDLRFVEETNEIRQCLLEVYVSVALTTPFNRWENT